jgi:hypothetical protein
MMTRLQFQHETQDGLHMARFVGGEEPLIREEWPGLLEEWSGEPNPSSAYNVVAGATDRAAYLGIVWALLAGRPCFGIARHCRERAAALLGRSFWSIRWEYEVDPLGPRGVPRDRGFVRARAGAGGSSVPRS